MSPAETDPRRRASSGKAALRCAALVLCIGAVLAPGGAARTAAGPALSFAAAKHYAIGRGVRLNYPYSMAIGELNGDGKPDVVAGNFQSPRVSVMLNRGDGTFEPRRVYLSARDVDVALGDLNGDGKPELVIVNGYLPSDGRVSVLVNAGEGTFGTRRDYDTTYPELVAIGDLNGDGKADVATADWQGTASVLLNRGDGSLGPEREYDCGS